MQARETVNARKAGKQGFLQRFHGARTALFTPFLCPDTPNGIACCKAFGYNLAGASSNIYDAALCCSTQACILGFALPGKHIDADAAGAFDAR